MLMSFSLVIMTLYFVFVSGYMPCISIFAIHVAFTLICIIKNGFMWCYLLEGIQHFERGIQDILVILYSISGIGYGKGMYVD